MDATRFNLPFKELLLIDVFKHYLVDGLLADDNGGKEEFVIAQDKVARKELICAVYANLIKITDVDFIKVALKYFLINDYDNLGATNPCNFINVLHQMIANCYIGGQTLEFSNLTNDVYIQLIETLLKFYTIHYAEAQTQNQRSD